MRRTTPHVLSFRSVRLKAAESKYWITFPARPVVKARYENLFPSLVFLFPQTLSGNHQRVRGSHIRLERKSKVAMCLLDAVCVLKSYEDRQLVRIDETQSCGMQAPRNKSVNTRTRRLVIEEDVMASAAVIAFC